MNDNLREAESVAETEGRSYSAPALEKGLDILEILCRSDKPLSQRDIAQRMGRSVGEIYRMLSCLVNRSYVAAIDDTYSITTKLFELTHLNPPTHRLLVEAMPVMHRIANALDQSCHLTVYGQGKQVVLCKVDAPSGMGFSVRAGAEFDMIISASGRVLLAFQDDETRKLRIEESLLRRPEQADPQLDSMLDAVRASGYEAIPSVQVRGLFAVAFPVLDTEGRAMAALTVPYAERLDQRQRTSIPEVIDALRDAADTLSSRVGGRSPVAKVPTVAEPAALARPGRRAQNG